MALNDSSGAGTVAGAAPEPIATHGGVTGNPSESEEYYPLAADYNDNAARARETLERAHDRMVEALDALHAGELTAAAKLVGDGSNYIGSALYQLRRVFSERDLRVPVLNAPASASAHSSAPPPPAANTQMPGGAAS